MRFGIFVYEDSYSGTPVNRWVSHYDPNAWDGFGEVNFKANPSEAIAFPDMGAAVEFYRQVSTVQPTRPDGKPNRPLTAYTVEIRALPEEVKES